MRPSLALDALYVAHGGIEDTPIEGQALLLLSDFSPVGGRKEALEDLTVVGRRRNVHPKRIARKRGHSHPARPGKNERIKVGGSEMLRGHLIDRDRVGLGAGNEVDIVPGQPVVWMNVTTDTPFDMGKAGEHGKMVAVMSKGLVGSGKRIVRTGILRKPLVLAYGAGNVETGETGRIPSLQAGGQRLAPKSIKKRQPKVAPNPPNTARRLMIRFLFIALSSLFQWVIIVFGHALKVNGSILNEQEKHPSGRPIGAFSQGGIPWRHGAS